MKVPDEITMWEMPSTFCVPDGYDQRSVPGTTWENMEYMVEEHNKLVRVVNELVALLKHKTLI